MAAGGGAALSTTLAGAMADYVSSRFAFFGLGVTAIMAVVAVIALIPETRPKS
jgi:predicted MFS family arabinose efflux permease